MQKITDMKKNDILQTPKYVINALAPFDLDPVLVKTQRSEK